MDNFDAIVAGAGIWGCTVARRLAEAGKRVLVLEKRAAVGGNCRCEIDPETGIEVHTYGSHIFHTSNEEVWKFVRRFTEFNDYRHCVLAKTKKVGGESRWTEVGSPSPTLHSNSHHTYHLPIGKTLLEEFFGVSMKERNLKEFLSTVQPSTSNLQPETPRTYGDAVFDAFIRGYTSKQWGVAPEKVDPSIIARLKVRDNYSTDYFDDPHQGIPADGYNKMFERMLDHPNITVQCGCELVFEKVGRESRSTADGLSSDTEGTYQMMVKGDRAEEINKFLCPPNFSTYSLPVYYSGPIDALFNYKYGALPWRTLRFERETLSVADYQGNSVVNYTDADVPYTRIHEFKHYHPEWSNTKKVGGESRWTADCKTIIMGEYSATWQPGDEPYYPINSPESAALLAKYQAEIEKINNFSFLTSHFSLVVGGRLGQYKYYDMDKSIAAALAVCI